VHVADDLSAKYPAAWPARVRIELGNGTVLAGGSDYPRGNPENPVTTPELEEKFLALVAPRFGPDVAARAVAAVFALTESADIAGVFPALLGVWSQHFEDGLAATPHA
jgi:2-methylcitrate dehydratase PrpD